jgi:hypothetical protein
VLRRHRPVRRYAHVSGGRDGAAPGAEEATMVPEINYWAVLLATASSMVVGSI